MPFDGINILAGGQPFPPEILAPSDLPPFEGSESGHLLPCSASTVRDRKRSPNTLNKNSTRAFQQAINQRLRRPQLPQNGDKVSKFVVFWTILTIKDEKSAAKFHYIKTVSGKVVAPFEWYQYIGRGGDHFPPEIVAPSDLPPPEGSEF